jgi:hypothetical protein
MHYRELSGIVRKIIRLLSVVAVAAPLLIIGVATQPTAAATNPVVQFQRAGTQLCIQLTGGSNETQLSDLVCNSSVAGQRWTVINDLSGLGQKFISPAAPTSCMNVQNGSTSPGAKIVVSDCSQDLSQVWTLVNTTFPANGTYVIQNANSHLCLNVVVGGLIEQNNCVPGSSTQGFIPVTVG